MLHVENKRKRPPRQPIAPESAPSQGLDDTLSRQSPEAAQNKRVKLDSPHLQVPSPASKGGVGADLSAARRLAAEIPEFAWVLAMQAGGTQQMRESAALLASETPLPTAMKRWQQAGLDAAHEPSLRTQVWLEGMVDLCTDVRQINLPQGVYSPERIAEQFGHSLPVDKIVEAARRASLVVHMGNRYAERPGLMVPSLTAMALLAAIHKEEYNIEIIVVSSALEARETLKQWTRGEGPDQIGLISPCLDKTKHVTCIVAARRGPQLHDIAILDSVGGLSQLHTDFRDILLLGLPHSTRIILARSCRQVDAMSCRTDALAMLKRALLHMKTPAFTDLVQDLAATPLAEDQRYIADIPAHLAHTIQRRAALPKNIDESDARVTKRGETIVAFLERYRGEVTVQTCVRGEMNSVILQDSSPRPMNLFLLEKGFRNARKIVAYLETNQALSVDEIVQRIESRQQLPASAAIPA